MSFSRRLATQLEDLRNRQRVKAWSLVTGLVATIYAVGIAGLAAEANFSRPNFDDFLVVLWAVGAIYGAGSLLAIGAINELSPALLRITTVGLWLGNLVVLLTTLALPAVLPFALIPVLGGFIVLRNRKPGIGWLYLSLPFLALGLLWLNSLLDHPVRMRFLN